ncbi:MAG: type II toxin-antitoxin system mRNA interferase toxin, RelE/StbE family [Candidatus Uhrbacteria bacterium]|nr:type II toxin-antitoxin system mRNA interferase toxin, RelE/StbE family [Candidatus Uhrbacteria bacterium]
MPVIFYTPEFKRDYKKLPSALQTLLKQKGRLFEQEPFHSLLRTHKLTGKLKGLWSFSVDYRTRVIFRFLGASEVELLRVGDHSVYRKKR